MHALDRPVLLSANPQRWKPEEILRTLVEAGVAARDASNVRTRMRQAGFPVVKRLEEFDVAASSIRPATFDYLASVEWIRAAENVCMIGPAGTGKSHTLIGWGRSGRSRTSGPLLHRRRSGRDPLPGTGRQFIHLIDTLLRNDAVLVDELGFAPLTTPEPRLPFRFVVAAYERRSLGIASHWPFESLGPVPARATTAVTMLHRLLPLPHRRHSRRLLPHETGQSEGGTRVAGQSRCGNLRDGSTAVHVAAPTVDAVDTTGAGDAFVGAFAFGLAEGMSATDAARAAASSRASGIPLRARLIRPTASRSGSEKEVPGRTARARTTNSRAAG